MNLSIFITFLITVIALVACFSSAQQQPTTNINPGCTPFTVGTREVDIRNWNAAEGYVNYTDSATGASTYFLFGVSLCQVIPYYTTAGGGSHDPGYIFLENSSFNPTLIFDGYQGGNHIDNVLTMWFVSSQNSLTRMQIVTTCDPNAHEFRRAPEPMTSSVGTDGVTTYVLHFHTEKMCATTEPATSTALPETTTTVANPGCAPFRVGERLVYPQSWGRVENGYFYTFVNHSAANFSTEIGMDIEPCHKLPSFTIAGGTTQDPSYAFMQNRTENHTGFHPFVTFDTFVQSRNNDFELIQEYGSTNNNKFALRLRTTCNIDSLFLTPASTYIGAEVLDGVTIFLVHLQIDKMCLHGNSTTAAPHVTTNLPTTRPAATQVPCAPIILDGKTVDPNIVWAGPVGGTLSLPQLPGTSAYVTGSMCSFEQGYTAGPPQIPGGDLRSYWIIGAGDNQFYTTSFNERRIEEVNQVGEFIKYKYTSSGNDNELFVYIHCRATVTGLQFQFNDLIYYNNTKGGYTFNVHLVSSAVCPAPTTVPPAQCTSFVDGNGVVKNPIAWPGTQGVLKNLMSGEAATVLIDVCKKHHFTSSPSVSFIPGFVILLPFDNDQWPQTSFDLIESARYLPGWLNEYQIKYRSSQVNRSQDVATVRVQCGASPGLSFADRFILPERNPAGGVTYQIALRTALMCDNATTALTLTTSSAPVPPPPTTAAAPTTLPATTGAALKHKLLRQRKH